jgi:hypothetical protein
MAGYDTAGQIQDTYVSARDEFGEGPSFWIRYFSPSPAADIFSDNAVAECQGAWASGGHSVGPVSAPYQSNLSGSTAQGQADAQTYAASMLSAYHAVGPLVLPSSNRLYCWLDQEYSTSLSLDYLDGWAGYIANYNFAGLGTYPLYPCLYCDPGSPYPNCSTMAAARGLNVPAAVWSSEPEPCGSLKNPPSSGAEHCATVPTKLWQYGEQDACGYSANVDLDVGTPGFFMPSFCFNVRSDP